MAELESELQKASYESYNAEHQLTQLSLKVRGARGCHAPEPHAPHARSQNADSVFVQTALCEPFEWGLNPIPFPPPAER